MPYHGIGSGILRALAAWPAIDFEDNRESSLFRVIVRRKMPPAGIAPNNQTLHQYPLFSGAKEAAFAPEPAPQDQDMHQNRPVYGANHADFAPGIAPQMQQIIARIAAKPQISVAELASGLKLSRRTILKRLALLKEKGIVARIGPNKGGKWQIRV